MRSSFLAYGLLLSLVFFPEGRLYAGIAEDYIHRYAPIAVSEMYRSGVPASITIAQGLLESRYGQSVLATEGNNHFGIKCHRWTGRTMSYDDDRKGECFRVYDSAEESFSDHSDFLRYSDRYKPLFNNDIKDYKAWAYGLKKAGYATDPAYPSKLIDLIERYSLYKYDNLTPEEADTLEDGLHEKGQVSKKGKRGRRAAKNVSGPSIGTDGPARVTIPEPPLELEGAVRLSESSRETIDFSLSREVYSLNSVPFIYSAEGETYSSIAGANNLFLKELLKFNDLSVSQDLEAGTMVYVASKRNSAAKGVDKYIVDHDGETLWEISQRFGVKLESLRKINGIPEDYVLQKEDTILLRPVKSGKK